LRTVAATTWDEYKKHFEKDPALTRRFQVVKVEEPSETKAILMMRGIVAPLEKHHKVLILDEAIEAAVRLSHRYIPARQLPDKSVSLIDTACARVAVSQHAVPAEVDDCRRRIQALETEQGILKREVTVGMEHTTQLAEVEQKLAKERSQCSELEKHWSEEKTLVAKVLDLRAQLRAAGSTVDAQPVEMKPGMAADPKKELTTEQRDAVLAELKAVQQKLAEFQGESPLIFPSVDRQRGGGLDGHSRRAHGEE
jgi:type VI secretion system protein VasG